MKLSSLFKKVAIKRLSRVETNPDISNQHELNGVKELADLFGIPHSKMNIPAKFIYLSDSVEDEFAVDIDTVYTDHGNVTWYDARKAHPTRTEYRLYYSSSLFLEYAQENDLMILGFDGQQVWVIVAEYDSTIESQLLWLFAHTSVDKLDIQKKFKLSEVKESDEYLQGVENLILEKFGIEVIDDKIDVEKLLITFQGNFPSTREFSEYARLETGIINSLDDPDMILLKWWNQEEKLFRTLEKYIIEQKIKDGFYDVDEFASFANSVLNRRKSRAGHAFENHLEQIFIDHRLLYDRGKKTENKSKPDFIFPSIQIYHQANNDSDIIPYLTMLGAKTTCKDRWRQVTKEAQLIEIKNLITLEPAISQDQTNEMQTFNVQLIVPEPVKETYSLKQQEWIKSISSFIKDVQNKQHLLKLS